MTASAYLVNFRINLGDLAEVALIWPDTCIYIYKLLKNNDSYPTHQESFFLKHILFLVFEVIFGLSDVPPQLSVFFLNEFCNLLTLNAGKKPASCTQRRLENIQPGD